MPQLLSARQVPEATLAAMTAATISPGFWTFLFSPLLDVRFSRRWYSVVTAVIAAALLALALLNLDDVPLVEGLLVTGFFFANLYQSALGGWLSSIITPVQKNALSVWVTIGNISGGGAMAMATGEIVQRLSPAAAALVLSGVLLLPTLVFFWMPARWRSGNARSINGNTRQPAMPPTSTPAPPTRAFNIANTYMLVVDGWGYAWHAVAGSYAVDASVSLAASLLMVVLLVWFSRQGASTGEGA